MKLPRRQTLLLQVVEIIREGLEDGTWKNFLPGERELSSKLHVSRPTVRAALEILDREQLISSSPGKPRKILVVPRSKKARTTKRQNSVTLVSKLPLHAMSRNRLYLFNALNRALQDSGIQLKVLSHEEFNSDYPSALLRALEKNMDSDAYLLALTSQRIQEWFVAHGTPSLILGSAFPGIQIPSIECDYPALGRHAAGTLLGKGHQNLAMIVPDEPLAGDLETEQAFRSEVERDGSADRQCRMIRYSGKPDDLLKKWNRLLKGDPSVTAAFSLYPAAALAILNELLSRKTAVPQQISILCRDDDPLCDWIQPRLAHYQLPLKQFASRLSTLVLQMVESGSLPMRHTAIMPDLDPGESLGEARAA